jgi:HSP20 family protein
VLTVSGHREEERKEEKEHYYAMERSYGQFTRGFTLPEGVDGDNIRANLKEGVLTLELQKKPEVQAKKISIGTAPGTTGAKA